MMLLKWLHRWLGICLCLFILNISITGTLLIWKKEYLWLSLTEARASLQVDIQSLAQTIETITEKYTPNELLLLQIHSEGLALHKAYIDQGSRAWHNQAGEIIQQWQGNERFEDWLVDLHHRFLLGNVPGLHIAGFSAILLIPMLAIGMIIWWPRRRSLSSGLLPSSVTKISKNELLKSHGNLGVLSLLPILIVTLSGIILTYPDQARQWLLEPSLSDDNYQISEGPLDSRNGKHEVAWLTVLQRALDQYPDAKIRWISPETDFTPYRIVGLHQPESWNKTGRTSIYIDAQEGYMDVNIDNLKRHAAERLFDLSYPIHTAKFGLWYRILLTLVGICLSLVALLGLVSFFKKPR
ncbi:MAG: PepSY domain-containing protein [Acidiferrobacterales bacterium]|nr:PepSY domain-containing protein [Acidiferrobacterales bacterium]